MITIQHVEPMYVQQVWPMVEPWLIPVFDKSDLNKYYTIDNLKEYLLRGEQTLLVAVDEDAVIQGVCAIQWLNMPSARIAYITAIGGRLITSKENHNILIDWVRACGGTRIEWSARESIVRLCKNKLGYTPRQITMEFQL